jgi:ABC-type amino acid transport substrate-binding protein
MSGLLRWRPGRLIGFLILTTALWAATLVGTRNFLSGSFSETYTKDAIVRSMHSAVNAGPATVYREAPPVDPEIAALPIMERVHRSGKLRVGYHPQNLPFSFFNGEDELVGFDVDMAHQLAADLGCDLEFIPADLTRSDEELAQGLYDILMTGSVMLPMRLDKVLFSDPYMKVTAAIIVPDHRRTEVEERMLRHDFSGFRLGVARVSAELPLFNRLLPRTETVRIASLFEYLDSGGSGADGCIWGAEAGSAWTLLYPAFSVVPVKPLYQLPVGYPLARNQLAFLEMLNSWISVVDSTGDRDRLYDYWIFGRDTESREARWSIMRNLLHWVE